MQNTKNYEIKQLALVRPWENQHSYCNTAATYHAKQNHYHVLPAMEFNVSALAAPMWSRQNELAYLHSIRPPQLKAYFVSHYSAMCRIHTN